MIDIFYFDGKLKKGDVKDLEKLKSKPIWIDMKGIDKSEVDILKNAFDLHPLTAEDISYDFSRIKVEEFNTYLFCIFYGINKSFNPVEFDFVLGENFIITSHKKEVESYEQLKSNTERLENLFRRGPDFIFHKLIDMEIDNFFPILEKIDDNIIEIEEEVTKKPNSKRLSQILNLKRELTKIKKITFPQREKISFLTKNDYRLISRKALPYFRDVYDHAIRVSDTIDNYKENIANTFDVYMSSVSNSMNEVMKTLSIIATIALPLSVISGIFGTNFINLPGSGNPYGFWIMIICMGLLSIFMIFFFKRRKWF